MYYSDLMLHYRSRSDELGRASKNRMYSLPRLDLEAYLVSSSFTRVSKASSPREGIIV